jgi:hypothetical protein
MRFVQECLRTRTPFLSSADVFPSLTYFGTCLFFSQSLFIYFQLHTMATDPLAELTLLTTNWPSDNKFLSFVFVLTCFREALTKVQQLVGKLKGSTSLGYNRTQTLAYFLLTFSQLTKFSKFILREDLSTKNPRNSPTKLLSCTLTMES